MKEYRKFLKLPRIFQHMKKYDLFIKNNEGMPIRKKGKDGVWRSKDMYFQLYFYTKHESDTFTGDVDVYMGDIDIELYSIIRNYYKEKFPELWEKYYKINY